MREFLVLTADERLGQLLKLLLRGEGNVTVKRAVKDTKDFDYIIADADSSYTPVATLTLSRNGIKGAMPIPFPHEELLSRVRGSENKDSLSLKISEDKRVAMLGEKRIALTEVEGRLLYTLASAGDYVSRSVLLKKVWGAEADDGVVNVYIHYLREKLETGGEKIILCSRKLGYKIDEKYLGGTIC